MFPTKPFDDEEHRTEHAIRHANVLNAVAQEPDIAGSFGWCMFDYNTHKDFGSGDRICYHGVMDMFRNPKLAAAVYSSQQEDTPVLELEFFDGYRRASGRKSQRKLDDYKCGCCADVQKRQIDQRSIIGRTPHIVHWRMDRFL